MTSERSPSHLKEAHPSKSAEARKVTKYASMYSKISYDFKGFSVEIGGRLGPMAEELIADAQKMWLDLMGKDAVPDGANWTCPSFSSYWRQRFVSVVQTSTAAMVLSRARRVAELRVLGV